jgi:lipopolysaccharide transport system permease protein
MLRNLWRYRSFVLGMASREFRARYLGSVLGSVWAVIHPLTLVFIYTVIFGHLMRSRLPGVDDALGYGIFLCAGIFTWGAFTEILQRSVTVFLENGNLLKKMSFPRATLPAIVLISALLNLAIVFGILLLILLVMGRFPGWSVLGLLPLLLVQQALALGLGIALGVLNVFFRDVGHLLAIALQLWFWFTPIVYPVTILGERTQALVHLNPMTDIVAGYQGILLHGTWPTWHVYLPQLGLAIGALLLGRALFRRLSGELADHL